MLSSEPASKNHLQRPVQSPIIKSQHEDHRYFSYPGVEHPRLRTSRSRGSRSMRPCAKLRDLCHRSRIRNSLQAWYRTRNGRLSLPLPKLNHGECTLIETTEDACPPHSRSTLMDTTTAGISAISLWALSPSARDACGSLRFHGVSRFDGNGNLQGQIRATVSNSNH